MPRWKPKPLVAAMLGAMIIVPVSAAEKVAPVKSETRAGPIIVETLDLTPRFLDFYAVAQRADPDARFALWSDLYGFAAVPPTPQGSALARQLLDAAWDRYAAALPRIREGAAAMAPHPATMIARVATLFGAYMPARVRVTVYVGGFEDNAFTYQNDAGPVLALPIESSPEFIALVGLHEAAHAMHILTAGLSGDYERSIGRVIFEEGLAMRAVAAIDPGKDERYYTEHRPGWFAAVSARRKEILIGLLTQIDNRRGEDVFRFTMGEGTTGQQREAYYAGWLVIDRLLKDGRSFAELARVPEAAMPRLVDATIRRLLVEG